MRELIGEERIAWFWANMEYFMIVWIALMLFAIARDVWKEATNEENPSQLRELYYMCHNWYHNWLNR
jgi:hypothetical protein